MGVVLWSLLFICLAVSTFVAAYGPANNDAPGAKTAAIVLMVVFLPMGLIPLLGAVGFGVGRRRFQGADAPRRYPTPAPPQYPIPTPPVAPPAGAAPGGGQAGDVAARLRKLDELRESGLLTEEEFAAKKAELLREL